jgi:hypothetical protein
MSSLQLFEVNIQTTSFSFWEKLVVFFVKEVFCGVEGHVWVWIVFKFVMMILILNLMNINNLKINLEQYLNHKQIIKKCYHT